MTALRKQKSLAMQKQRMPEEELTFTGHLSELRKRLLVLFAAFTALFCIGLYKADAVISLFTCLGRRAGYRFVYISPEEVMVQQLRTAAVMAVLIMIPLTMYEALEFIAPAFSHKKAYWNMCIFFAAGFVMFITGAVFSYRVMLPFSLKYFGDIEKAAGINAEVSLAKFLDFVLAMILAIGISFDFPVVCFLLSAIGIVDSSMLKKARPVVIVAIFIVAAIITPPDVMTQLMPN